MKPDDVGLREQSGLKIIGDLQNRCSAAELIRLRATAEAGAIATLYKPFKPPELIRAIEQALPVSTKH